MINKKSYYAIIPAEVRYDNRLSPNAKLLYGEISALSNEEGFCWASNKYFQDLYGVSRRSVQLWIGDLERAEHIRCKMVDKTKRRIYLSTALPLVRLKPNGERRKLHGGVQKTARGGRKNLHHNITMNNTKNKDFSFERIRGEDRRIRDLVQ